MSSGRGAEPVVPTAQLEDGGWELREETTDTVFELPAVRVVGHTKLYEDAALRERLREKTGTDQVWRFFFATALEFTPALATSLNVLIQPTVVAEAKRSFEDDLRARGFQDIKRGQTQTMRIDGNRARLTNFRANYPIEVAGDDIELQVSGWLAVWHGDGFRLAGGGYPESGFDELAEEGDAGAYRDELIGLFRNVR